MRLQPFQWLRSLHAKLFIATALVTSVLTFAVAFSITRNSRVEMEGYAKELALQTSQAVETEIVEQLIKECSRLYDLVLIDSPPLLPVTDPLVFSPLCDATVLVVKAGVTQRQSVRRALQLVHQSGGHVAGCIG